MRSVRLLAGGPADSSGVEARVGERCSGSLPVADSTAARVNEPGAPCCARPRRAGSVCDGVGARRVVGVAVFASRAASAAPVPALAVVISATVVNLGSVGALPFARPCFGRLRHCFACLAPKVAATYLRTVVVARRFAIASTNAATASVLAAPPGEYTPVRADGPLGVGLSVRCAPDSPFPSPTTSDRLRRSIVHNHKYCRSGKSGSSGDRDHREPALQNESGAPPETEGAGRPTHPCRRTHHDDSTAGPEEPARPARRRGVGR